MTSTMMNKTHTGFMGKFRTHSSLNDSEIKPIGRMSKDEKVLKSTATNQINSECESPLPAVKIK